MPLAICLFLALGVTKRMATPLIDRLARGLAVQAERLPPGGTVAILGPSTLASVTVWFSASAAKPTALAAICASRPDVESPLAST